MKKLSLCLFVSMAWFFAIVAGIQAETFTASDLEGTWNGYAIEVDPTMPAVYWFYGTFDVDNAGNITDGSMTAPGQTASITSGSATLSTDGSLSGSFTTDTGVTGMVMDGLQDQSHTLLSYVSADTNNALSLVLGFKAGGNYVQADMEGDWRVYGIEVDAGDELVYWVMGDASIDSLGNMSGIYSAPIGPSISTTGGQISIDQNGKLSGGMQFEGGLNVTVNDGMLDQGESICSFVSSNNQNQLDFVVGLKKGATYHPSDLEGDWTIYNFVIDPASGAAYWIYGNGTIDNAGNLSGTYTGPDGSTLSIASGSMSLSTAGELSGSFTVLGVGTETLQSGFMDENKTVIAFVGISDNGQMDMGLGFRTSDPPPIYSYTYYLPYFVSDYVDSPNYWSGLGLTNLSSTEDADVIVVANNNGGQTITTEDKTIAGNGQQTFVVGNGLSGEGWMRVGSTQPLGGLCFFGTLGVGNYMADITLIRTLSKSLDVPHVAQNSQWDTILMICNPNPSATEVTLQYYNPGGTITQSAKINIPANGSAQFALKTFADLIGDIRGGHVRMTGNQEIAAFALYNNIKTGGYSYSGISSIDPDDQ